MPCCSKYALTFSIAITFVPAHAEASEDVSALAQYNIGKVLEIGDRIVDLCGEPLCFEALLRKLFAHYSAVSSRTSLSWAIRNLCRRSLQGYPPYRKEGSRTGWRVKARSN